jgi:hypothetical protein
LLTQNNEEVKVVQELLRHANSRITLDLYAQAGMPTNGWHKANLSWRMDHGYRQLVALDHEFRAGTHARQHVRKVAGGFRFRDMDHMVGHGAITPSFLLLGDNRGPNRRQIFCGDFFAGSIVD